MAENGVAEKLPPDGRSMTPVDKFREFLDIKKLKVTEERLRIVRFIFEAHQHFDVEQLLESMREKKIPASRPTVYRTLNLLVESGLLRRLTFGNVTAYEHAYGYPRHEHLFCERCGGVIEFVSEELDRLLEKISREHRFRPVSRKLVVQGVCEKCARPKADRRRLDLI
jgi:Fur family ferric uptake transcriptional regulator